MLTLPQNGQKYLLCWLTSIFLICLRRLAPYRVPYLPTMPTFLVRFDCTRPKQTCCQPSFRCKTRTHNSLVTIREPRLHWAPVQGCHRQHAAPWWQARRTAAPRRLATTGEGEFQLLVCSCAGGDVAVGRREVNVQPQTPSSVPCMIEGMQGGLPGQTSEHRRRVESGEGLARLWAPWRA